MKLRDYSDSWSRHEDGIWRDSEVADVSYPSDGNEFSYQIEDDSFWFQHRNRVITSLLTRFPPTGPMFDVGGGNGCVTRAIQDTGTPCVLVEPGANGVSNAVARGVEHVVQSMWSDETVNQESAPAIGLFDVVEHIEDHEGFLATIHRTLQPDGLVFISVPAYQWLWSVSDSHAGHFRRYRRQQLEGLLASSGFRVEFSTYLFSPLPIPVFLSRSLPSRLGVRREVRKETSRKQHAGGRSIFAKVIAKLLDRECSRISKGKAIVFGSSCMIVARKAHEL